MTPRDKDRNGNRSPAHIKNTHIKNAHTSREYTWHVEKKQNEHPYQPHGYVHVVRSKGENR